MGTVFFWGSKLTWLILAPDHLLLILLFWASFLIWRGKKRWGQRLLGLVCVCFLVIALFPVDEWVLAPLEIRFASCPALPDTVDGILVLGGAENAKMSATWGLPEVTEAADRDIALVTLARRYPQAQLVYSGGSGRLIQQKAKGADVTQRLFADLGLDTSKIIFERQSRNTFENVINTQALVQPDANDTWVVITSSWHMPRAIGVFRQAGWQVIPYPVDHWSFPAKRYRVALNFANNLYRLKIGLKEWVGLFAYYATGKTHALLPGHEPSLPGQTTLN